MDDLTAKQINQMAMKKLKKCRDRLTPQQYRTIKGQILSGSPIGAMKGLQKILER